MDIRIILLPLIIFPLGLVTFLVAQQAWQTQRRSLDARDWSRTTGRVIQSSVVETQVSRRSSVSVARYRFVTRYVPEVVYEYQVAGTLYHGARLQLGFSVASSDSSSAQRQADRYPVGSEVTVYYHPDNPAESTLSLKAGWGVWVMWGVALIMLFVTIFTALLMLSIAP
jgi:hypothetical protein